MLPILHLNGYKISNPTVLARITREELEQLFRGYGWTPYFVEEEAERTHARGHGLDARSGGGGDQTHPTRSPRIRQRHASALADDRAQFDQGLDGTEMGRWRCKSKAPFARIRCRSPIRPRIPSTSSCWKTGCKSYRPEELFDEQGRLKPELAELAPEGERRMGANPHANGGMLLRDLRMPDFRDYAEDVPAPGAPGIGDTHVLGPFLRDVAKLNDAQRNFRVFRSRTRRSPTAWRRSLK